MNEKTAKPEDKEKAEEKELKESELEQAAGMSLKGSLSSTTSMKTPPNA